MIPVINPSEQIPNVQEFGIRQVTSSSSAAAVAGGEGDANSFTNGLKYPSRTNGKNEGKKERNKKESSCDQTDAAVAENSNYESARYQVPGTNLHVRQKRSPSNLYV